MLNTSKGSRVAHLVNKQKTISELLVEELKQGEEEATQAQQEADVKLLEAKKLASQYQKEADKCSSGNTCEEAREKSAVALVQQKKLTSLWEQRARISISMQLLAFLPQFFLTWAKDLCGNISETISTHHGADLSGYIISREL